MRAVVDGLAARCAAIRVAAGADSRPLQQAFAELAEASRLGDYDRFAEADRRLHYRIVELAGIDVLSEVIEVVFRHDRLPVETLRLLWPDLDMLCQWHQRLVDAICAGDTKEAESVTKTHFGESTVRLAEQTDNASLPGAPLARACAYLAFHLHEPVQLKVLARQVAETSTGHLARLFHREFGMSFTEYVRELRMQKALDLLVRSQFPIGRVATVVGYRDNSRFSDHFRRQFGLTPRAYRKKFARGMSTNRRRST